MHKRLLHLLYLVLLTALLTDCARFRIEELQGRLLHRVPIHVNSPDQTGQEKTNQTEGLVAGANGRFLHSLPVLPGISGNELFLANPVTGMVSVYEEGDSEPQYYFSAAKKESEADFVQIPAGPLGLVTAADETVFIQIYGKAEKTEEQPPQPVERVTGALNPDSMDQSSSYIVSYTDTEPSGRIGPSGLNPQKPFQKILKMHAYEPAAGGQIRLAVLHKNPQITLSIFEAGRLVSEFQYSPEPSAAETAEAEWMVPYTGEDAALAQVIYRNKNTFEPVRRDLVKLSPLNGSTESKLILSEMEPVDYLSWAKADGSFVLESDHEQGAGVLFRVYSPAGEYLNNQLVEFSGLRHSWREVFRVTDNRILAVRIHSGNYEIYEWAD